MVKFKFMSIEELLEKRANKAKLTVVDVLPEESFREGHIPGAVSIPLERIATEAPKMLKKTTPIAVYCGGYACGASTKAAEILLGMGYSKTVDFKAGKKGWIAAGLELEK